MPRLIDADALKEEMDMEWCPDMTVSEIWYVIDCAPTVGGWVSVNDRLPEIGKVVLAFGTRSATTGMFRGTMINRLDVWMWKHNTSKKVTHWMPLPEPPKEET